jgi:hypothetical protein
VSIRDEWIILDTDTGSELKIAGPAWVNAPSKRPRPPDALYSPGLTGSHL